MRLTGLPLSVAAVAGTLVVAALTVWLWERRWRLRLLRPLLRTAGVLLTEASLLVSVGLVVNRHEQFFPTWASLFEAGDAAAPAYATVAGGLDQQLTTRAAGRLDQPLAMPWQPAGWTDWHLAATPLLVVPAGYLAHPQWRYSVVLVVGTAGPLWPASPPDPRGVEVAARASQDVVVYLSPTAGTTVAALAAEVPAGLRHDLRVTDHRWAVAGLPADAKLVRQVAVAAAPGQFPAVATVLAEGASAPPVKSGGASATPGKSGASAPPGKSGASAAPGKSGASSAPGKPGASSAPGKSGNPGKPGGAAAGPGRSGGGGTEDSLPVGVATFTVRAGAGPAGALDAVSSAVGWAAGQTPPPMAASSPPVKSLPVHRHPRAGTSSAPAVPPARAGVPNRKDQPRGPGQPWR